MNRFFPRRHEQEQELTTQSHLSDCPHCGDHYPHDLLDEHIECAHKIDVRVTYTGAAKGVMIMYNNQGRKLQAGHDGLFRTVISVEEGPLEFCFVTAEDTFQLANNHEKLIDKNVNVVNIVRESCSKEIYCCCYSFEERIASSKSQFSDEGGASACTAIALEALSRILGGPMMSSESHINTALRNGKATYKEVQKALSVVNGVEHLAPSEVYHSSTALSRDLDNLGWCQGDCLSDGFCKVKDVMEFVNRTGCPAGATVTISNLTVAFCMMGKNARPHLFDSHSADYGDRKETGASLFIFSDVDQLIMFLVERFPQDPELQMLALSVYELNVFAKKGTLEDASNLQMAESLFQKPFPPAILPTPHEHEKTGPEEEVVQGAAKSHTESSVPPVTTHQPQDASGIFEETGKQIKIFAQCIQRTQEAGRSLRAGMDQNERLWTARMDVMNECLVPLKSCLDELYSMYTKHRELCNFFQQLLLIGEFLDIADHQLSKFMKDEFAAKNSGVLIIKESLEGQRETWNKIMQIIQPLIQEEASKQVRAAHSTTLPPSNGQSSSCAHPCEPVKVSNSSQSYRESRERELRAPIPPLDASYAQSEMPEGADRSNSSYNSQEGAQDINHGATSQAVQNGTHGMDADKGTEWEEVVPRNRKARTTVSDHIQGGIPGEHTANKRAYSRDQYNQGEIKNVKENFDAQAKLLKLIAREGALAAQLKNVKSPESLGFACSGCNTTVLPYALCSLCMHASVHGKDCLQFYGALGFKSRPVEATLRSGRWICKCGECIGVTLHLVADQHLQCSQCQKTKHCVIRSVGNENFQIGDQIHFLFGKSIRIS